jgi:hypothetical protein
MYSREFLIGSFNITDINYWLKHVRLNLSDWRPAGHTIKQVLPDRVIEYKTLGMMGEGTCEDMDSRNPNGFFVVHVQSKGSSYHKIDHIDKILPFEDLLDGVRFDYSNHKIYAETTHWINSTSFTINNCKLDNSSTITRVGDILTMDFANKKLLSSIIDITTSEVDNEIS